MDTELLRTFIEITRTRHFGRAAANLYLTQSAVSARMRLLEDTLGVRLLTRERNDVQLTPPGRILLEHAEEIVSRWTQARQAVAVRDEGRVAIKAGILQALSDVVLQDWLESVAAGRTNVSLGVELLDEAVVLKRFEEGSLDLALTLNASNDQRLRSREVGRLCLKLYGSSPDAALDDTYVYVDWGPWFDAAHAKLHPDYLPGALRLPTPRLAAALIASAGGSAYLPDRIAAEASLVAVPGLPEIDRTIYGVFPAESDRRATIEALLTFLDSGEND